MNRVIVDASVAVEYLLKTENGASAAEVLEKSELFAPELLDVEVLSVLRRAVLRGILDEARARFAIDDLEIWGVERISHRVLSKRAWKHFRNLSAYDSYYVAAADVLNASLLTADKRIARVPNLPVVVNAI
ncbi:MAG: type II toxin-antitoxin system VapC family toxin [Chloroflexota bacterium]|nr:type II toxin-antitoxin system VapC family toxin [Chloroflexota bacterium]